MSSTLCWSFNPSEVIGIAREHRFSGIEFWAEHVWRYDADPFELAEAAAAASLDLTVHAASWDLNITALNPAMRKQSVAELKRSIDLTSDLGASHMTFHPGKLTLSDRMMDVHFQMLLSSVTELMDYAEQKGVVLSMELMEEKEKELISRPPAMNSFLSLLDRNLHTTIDIAHVPLYEDSCQYFKQTTAINSIHLSDSTASTYHVPLGEGCIDFRSILPMIMESRLPIVLEGMDDSRELGFLKTHLDYLNHFNMEQQDQLMYKK
ncbi:sugar phosphate isomerase/epimerase family protein [Salinicoccus hispanicus]|uniref:TIM barrel protein n=1 Tax=Salinicoccus hispanicus TaxID=157225 RepID=A0A6N8TZP2_9STAP|nr:sugar phosphate isomerase/epimerase family protein [Salinicoccus hispanicus]MXQ51294.1 TIM barrel protein [Salinicoccus hispanicus]